MHELSIARSLIDLASQAAREEGSQSVTRINIRIGQLSGVVKEALLFSFELAAEDTPCDGAFLSIEEVQVTAFCPHCNLAKPLAGPYDYRCPTCGKPTQQILTGQELELVSIEIESTEDCPHVTSRT